MPLKLSNPAAFTPMMDTLALVKRPGVRSGAEERVMATVSGANPYAENVGGAARAEFWTVCFEAKASKERPVRGTLFSFPGRADLPPLYAQRSYLLGGVFHVQCTNAERPSA